MVVTDQYTRRIVGLSAHARVVDGPTLCRMFNEVTVGQCPPNRIITDNDPLFQYRQWQVNLSILQIEEIKSLPYAPMSHPFVERLIGGVRRERLDQTFFWTQTDLENKFHHYQQYYSQKRGHSSRSGSTPSETFVKKVIDLIGYRWDKHCRGLFQLTVAA